MKTSEMIAVMQAFERGEKIEYRQPSIRPTPPAWRQTETPSWNWAELEYRVAPKKVMIRHYKTRSDSYVSVALKNYNEKEDDYTEERENTDKTIWLDEWHEASFGPQE